MALILSNILLPISIVIATPKIFPTYYYIDYRTIPIRLTYYFYKSLPYRDAADISLAPTESVTPTLLGLLDPPAPPPYTRLPHRPFIMVPNTAIIAIAAYPPTFRLADR
jgi:hypothetical protein